MLSQSLTVAEFLRRAFQDYPGIARFAPRLLMGMAAVAILIVIGTSTPDLALVRKQAWILISQRYLVTGLTVIVGLTMLFFARIAPSAARRGNILIHGRILAVYLASLTAGLFAYNRTNTGAHLAVNTSLLVIGCLCFAAWTYGLRPAGERQPVVQAPSGAGSAREDLLAIAEAAREVWRAKR
ncbi:MAG: hypothetical protein K2X03_14220 [Bryobacteraceae bacterium]|nr:hypothetical protein [Bryobacteraceae bacterium]